MKRLLLIVLLAGCGKDCRHDPQARNECKPITIGGSMIIGYRC